MPKFSDDFYNINLELAENNLDELVQRIEEEEEDAMLLAMGPRAFGPDADEDGLMPYYWEK